MSCSSLHHLEICLENVIETLQLFKYCLGFSVIATRSTLSCDQWVLRQCNTTIVLTQRRLLENTAEKCSLLYDDNSSSEEIKFKVPHLNNINAALNNACQDDSASRKTDKRKCYSVNDCFHRPNESNKQIFQSHSSEEDWTVFCCRNSKTHVVDSVFNTAIVVSNVSAITRRVEKKGGTVIKQPTHLSDADGELVYSIIATEVGNIVHTLIDRSKYHGVFLPGFTLSRQGKCHASGEDTDNSGLTDDSNDDGFSKNDEAKPNVLLSTHVDHIAYVCHEGDSHTILQWYEDIFNMKRFLLNNEEDIHEGLTIKDNVGLRLKAMEYFKCSETGLYSPTTNSDLSLKFVISEPITSIKDNHVSAFLRAHGGPGIQHLALHTPTMLASVEYMAKRGMPFRRPPLSYYEEGGKMAEMVSLGLGKEVKALCAAGVLLDTEADPPKTTKETGTKERYLMQIFTEPVFGRCTFFLEVIHRAGAAGFGVGNITALARSIELDRTALILSGGV